MKNLLRTQHPFSFISFFLAATLLCFSATNIGAGTLDPTFGENGITTTSLNHYGDAAKAVIIDENDRILVAGTSANGSDIDFSLARYLADGNLDKTFNFDGIVSTQIGNSDDQATSIALQEDGKIVVAGYTSNGQDSDFALARYNPDGSLDETFGLGGIVVLPVGLGDDQAHGIAIQKDGAIVIAGSAGATSGRVAALTRIDSRGTIDKSFGHNGLVFANSKQETIARDVVIQDDNSILVTGEFINRDGETTLLLMRYLGNGTPDTGFGTDGSSDTASTHDIETAGTSLLVQENGSILVAGSAGAGEHRDIALFHFSAQGTYNPSFGTRGMVTHDILGEADGAYDLVVVEDTVMVGGYTTANGLRDFVLLHYSFPVNLPENTDDAQPGLLIGEPVVEETFTSSSTLQKIAASNTPDVGVTTTSISSFDDTGYGIATQKNNKVILVGTSEDNGTSSYTIARYSKDIDGATKADASVNPYIVTTPVTEIKRNSAIAGGEILNGSNFTFSSRGVVFSIAPYPSTGDSSPSTSGSSSPNTGGSGTDGDTSGESETESGRTTDGSGVGRYGSILTNLAIGTRYYVRAYAVASDGNTYYGNQLSFETKDACFIATAAYGSESHPHVSQLRTFRDHFLMQHSMGRRFVTVYYDYSPIIADTIDAHPFLRPLVRTLLLPVVGISSLLL